jgi:hypothetical protein
MEAIPASHNALELLLLARKLRTGVSGKYVCGRANGREYDRPVGGSRRRWAQVAVFGLLTLLAELTGRSITHRLDHRVRVEPLAAPMAPYYPFLLAGIRILAALALAAVAWRLVRAHAAASAGEALLRRIGERRFRPPTLRVELTPRLWLASFGATSLWFLVQNDAERLSEGRWPFFAPWLHTYSLPVFAVLSVLLAVAWNAVRNWMVEVERYIADTYERVCRALRGGAVVAVRARPCDDRAPRHLFGAAFESRPPPLPA